MKNEDGLEDVMSMRGEIKGWLVILPETLGLCATTREKGGWLRSTVVGFQRALSTVAFMERMSLV